MKIEDGLIVEITENELFSLYLEKGYDDVMSFNEYMGRMEASGCVVVKEQNVKLVNVDDLMKKAQWMEMPDNQGINFDVRAVTVSSIEDAPIIEVEPIKHGRWERTDDGAAYCTACKRKMNPSQYGYAYCALCGAKMDGGTA